MKRIMIIGVIFLLVVIGINHYMIKEKYDEKVKEIEATKELYNERQTIKVNKTMSGESVYKNNCSTCHGNQLEGGFGPNIENINEKFSKEELMDIFKNGKGMMPKMLISEDEKEKLTDWIMNEEVQNTVYSK